MSTIIKNITKDKLFHLESGAVKQGSQGEATGEEVRLLVHSQGYAEIVDVPEPATEEEVAALEAKAAKEAAEAKVAADKLAKAKAKG